MRRFLMVALGVCLALSLAGNALLGWVSWQSQKEYRALAGQFVKTKAELNKLRAQAQAQAQAQPQPVAAAQPKPAQAEAAKPVAAAPAAAQAPAAPVPAGSVEAVRTAYAPRFAAVQADCEGQLDGLLQQAKAEYKQAQAGGKVDVAVLAAKFYPRAESLRRDCDRRVEGLLSQMSGDLRAAGLPTDLVAEVRQAYEERIVERQAEIMAKAGQ